jgi:hypothetical protein
MKIQTNNGATAEYIEHDDYNLLLLPGTDGKDWDDIKADAGAILCQELTDMNGDYVGYCAYGPYYQAQSIIAMLPMLDEHKVLRIKGVSLGAGNGLIIIAQMLACGYKGLIDACFYGGLRTLDDDLADLIKKAIRSGQVKIKWITRRTDPVPRLRLGWRLAGKRISEGPYRIWWKFWDFHFFGLDLDIVNGSHSKYDWLNREDW